MFVGDAAVIAAVEEEAAGLRVLVAEGAEAAEVFGTDAGRVLHFDGGELVRPVQDEVHLEAGAGPPGEEAVAPAAIVGVGAQVLRDQTLERGAVDLLRAVERSLRAQGAKDAAVEVEELRMRRESAFGALPEYRQSKRQQQVLPIPPGNRSRCGRPPPLPGRRR